MGNPSLLLAPALGAYLAASVLYVASLTARGARGASRIGLAATTMAGIGLLAHTAGLFGLVAETGRSPYSTFYGAIAFTAWLVVLMQLGAVARWRLYSLGAISMPFALLMLLYAVALPPEMRKILPTLREHTMAAHISVALLGYGAFAVAFGLAIIYLTEERMLKTKRLRGLIERLPPLGTAEELASRFAAFGHAMLTLGIFIGTVYGIRDWGARFWSDPKVVPSLVTWAIYTVYLLLRWVAGFRGRVAAYILVAGFVAVLVTFVGVNILFPGKHGSYDRLEAQRSGAAGAPPGPRLPMPPEQPSGH